MIKVYTKTVCPKCIVVKAMLEDSGLQYEVINLEENVDAREKVFNMGFQGVPIVEYKDNFLTDNGQILQLINELK